MYRDLIVISLNQYYRDLILTRLTELKVVSDQKLLNDVEQSSQRVSYQVGTLSDYLLANRQDLGNEIPKIIELLTEAKILVTGMRDKFPSNTSFNMLIQHSINSIDLNLEKLK